MHAKPSGDLDTERHLLRRSREPLPPAVRLLSRRDLLPGPHLRLHPDVRRPAPGVGLLRSLESMPRDASRAQAVGGLSHQAASLGAALSGTIRAQERRQENASQDASQLAWSTFFVRAHTPAPPENLRLLDPHTLGWDESKDADFGAVVDPGAIPTVFGLGSCQPNPFKGMTRIHLALPRAERVRVKVYDTGGRMVRALVDGELPAASYSVFWPGTDADGRQLPSGVYMIRMEAGSLTTAVRTVILE